MNRHLLAALAVFVAIVGVGVAAHDRFPFSAGSADHSPSSAVSADRPLGAFGGQDKQQPTFRSGVIAVPIEVRVLDREGRPITDLKKEDFTVLEDGAPQTIAHFVLQSLAAEAPGRNLRAGPVQAEPDAARFDPSPQRHRIFLIVLGNAALGDPGKHPEHLDALLKFVRERLLPQDQVALLANNRATDFTTDHAKLVQILEQLRTPDSGDRWRLTAQGNPVPAGLPPAFHPMEAVDPTPPTADELGLQEYLAAHTGQLNELDSLFYGVRYLRFLEGEKHLVYVTMRGAAPTWDQANQLIRSANDARVALDTITVGDRVNRMPIPTGLITEPPGNEPHFGGNPKDGSGVTPGTAYAVAGTSADPTAAGQTPRLDPGGPPNLGSGGATAAGSLTGSNAAVLMAGTIPEAAALPLVSPYDFRRVAAMTGGQSSMFDDTDAVLGRIDAGTRVSYLLAYYPSNPKWDGRYRKVTVRVNREGATVLYRAGYSARLDVEPFDRGRMLADAKIESAATSLAPGRDIDLQVTPTFTKAAKGAGGEVTVTLVVDANRLGWTIARDGRHAARLDVSVYCGDWWGKVLASDRRVVNIALNDESYARVLKEGFSRTVKVSVTGRIELVKIIVYDYGTMRVGSAVVKVK